MDAQSLSSEEASALWKDEIHIWLAELDRPASEVQELFKTLTPDERARAQRFHFSLHRDRFIVGRGLLRIILSRYLDAEPEQLRFSYNEYGKPSLLEDFGGGRLRFNLAHSRNRALYAASCGRELGVDIEYMNQDFACLDIAERFFSVHEVNELCSLPSGKRREAFFNCWTRKEAYIKARGHGLSISLHEFDVSLVPGHSVALLRDREHPQEALRWSLHAPDVGPDYAAAIAVEGHQCQLKIFDSLQ